jgi:hypothetical protein
MQERQPFCRQLQGEIMDAGDVATRSAKLATRPALTGSIPTLKTIGIGILAVAALAVVARAAAASERAAAAFGNGLRETGYA